MLNKIIKEIRKKGYDINGVVQHSYNPTINECVQFYVYSDNRISHIVSTLRDPAASRHRMHEQNRIMHLIFDRVNVDAVRKNILFDSWLLDLPGGCFRIQRFKESKFRFRVVNYNLKRLNYYLDLSTEWLVDFQRVTRQEDTNVGPDDIKRKFLSEIEALKRKWARNSKTISFLSVVTGKLDLIQTQMPLCARHGDYCYWNCFIDIDDVFRVIDWEFADVSDWVIGDYISNLLVLWIDLKRQRILTGTVQNLFKPVNTIERVLNQNLLGLAKHYNFNLPEIKLYLVYVFISIYMRETRPVASKYWTSFLDDMLSVFN